MPLVRTRPPSLDWLSFGFRSLLHVSIKVSVPSLSEVALYLQITEKQNQHVQSRGVGNWYHCVWSLQVSKLSEGSLAIRIFPALTSNTALQLLPIHFRQISHRFPVPIAVSSWMRTVLVASPRVPGRARYAMVNYQWMAESEIWHIQCPINNTGSICTDLIWIWGYTPSLNHRGVASSLFECWLSNTENVRAEPLTYTVFAHIRQC